tara:strand:- start:180 stop:932 length:753 start_codon:yes stop_codon:yes gene_type:complete
LDKNLLKIENLHVSVEGKDILKGLNLDVKAGELHVIMGRNGTGKSTLANVLIGKDGYNISKGTVDYKDQPLLDMETEQRANEGIFLSFQYPVAIPGVNNISFLKAAINSKRKYLGEKEIDSATFLKDIRSKMKILSLDDSFIQRSLNDGFSGGEKKRNEMLQMLALNPILSILDETDSGLDIDALKTVAKSVNEFRNKNNSFIIITHYQRMLNYLEPDYIHVLMNGKIVKSGDKSLALSLEEKGYDWIDG